MGVAIQKISTTSRRVKWMNNTYSGFFVIKSLLTWVLIFLRYMDTIHEDERKMNVEYYSTSVVSSVDPSGGSEEGVRSGGLYDGYQYKLPEGYWDENNVSASAPASAYLLLDWATAKAMCDYHLLNWDTMISYVVEEAAQLGRRGGTQIPSGRISVCQIRWNM